MIEHSAEWLGKQLRCPSGKEAKEIGENMFQSNHNMILESINHLALSSDTHILEIGFGNAKHLSYLFNKEKQLKYYGIDISKEMVDEAEKNNDSFVRNEKAVFQQVCGNGLLSFENETFHSCFTINTIYFWQNPQFHFDEIYRVLKEKGLFVISFIEQSFGQRLPFTQKDFIFYEIDTVEAFLHRSGFQQIETYQLVEDAISKNGQKVIRPFVIMTATKNTN
ncbi:MAG: class I SAM-dependent methyltransferase [Dysgonomonas sp.]